ncbi:regulatory signaling modulator protein AmpE [Pseudomonas matsuisoli]|uniref:Membrane protein n=1 Tax=Pseudomonas matsuisoli TaxID=1515666 RepID=A0A917PX88_9PSED|nr:regulatory signaling modulator protein AmpE [Pseudomonas matsuisoli]GGJ96897.1 membrane protein [Pseudomonas matsuisoli]
MNFLVLLLVVGIEKFSPWRRRVQADGLWIRQLRRVEKPRSDSIRAWWIIALLVLLPAMVLGVVLSAIEPIAYGLLALPVHLLVVLFSLGRGGVQAGLGPFRDACRRGDTEGAYLVARRDLGIDEATPEALAARVQQRFVWQAFEGFFAIVFWYALLGPVLALVYRLVALIVEHSAMPGLRERAALLQHALDWLPARALAVTFGLVGDFVALNQALLNRLLDWDISAARLVTDAGRSAAELSVPTLDEDGNVSLDALWQLLVRSAVLWYVVLALWVVFV